MNLNIWGDFQICISVPLINDQSNTFFSSIRVNYVLVNFVGTKGCVF